MIPGTNVQGIPVGDKNVDLPLLATELTAAGVPHSGTGGYGTRPNVVVHTYDQSRVPAELPPQAVPVVNAHVAPPRAVQYAQTHPVDAVATTTDATPLTVFTFPCDQQRLYSAALTIRGIDRGNFASKSMVGAFTWKRLTGNAIVVGITVISDIHDAAATGWAPNCLPSGTNVVFTVAGAAGRTVDWKLEGQVEVYAPGGLEA